MIMTYYKLLDNIADDKGIKKLFFITLKPFIKSANKKAAKKYPYIEKIVADYINKQNTLEKENCTDTDKAADPTAVALAQILMLCSTDTSQKRVLERLGYCLGRYIYLTDAYFDLEQDIKTGSYNVLKNKPTAETENYVKSQIYFCINEATKAFELLDIKKYKTILGNILYLGLEETLQKEIKK